MRHRSALRRPSRRLRAAAPDRRLHVSRIGFDGRRCDDADAPGCDEGVPHQVEPFDQRADVVAEIGDRIYVVVDEDSAGRPGGGVDVEGAVLDEAAVPTPVDLDDAEIGAVLEGALAGDAASDVAEILTADAERYVAASVWSRAVTMNPDLIAVEGGGVVAP